MAGGRLGQHRAPDEALRARRVRPRRGRRALLNEPAWAEAAPWHELPPFDEKRLKELALMSEAIEWALAASGVLTSPSTAPK
jgi:hypothetical protein